MCVHERSIDIGGEEIAIEHLWDADFGDADEYLVECQEAESEVTFADGSLQIDCLDAGGVTVWARSDFPEDVLVEYRATCSEPEAGVSSRNLNCFFAAREEPDRPLDATTRTGAYPDYHDFPNYIFTLTRTHSRLRRDPGFELKDELMMGIQPDEEYTVRLLKRGDEITTDVNGRVIHEWTDPDPHSDGWIGLRTYDTDVTYDHWAVYGLE